MKSNALALNRMSNAELVSEVHRLAGDERQATAALLEALGELDARQLYLDEGCSSLFGYCRDVLAYSEDEACTRVRVARAARLFPLVLQRIAESRLTLTAARLLAPHLTDANHREVLAEACGKTKEQVELIVARLNPKPDAEAMLRKMPESASQRALASSDDNRATPPLSVAAASAGTGLDRNESSHAIVAPAARSVVAPLSPERYKLQVTISGETRAKLKRAQDLLRHAVPSGDLAGSSTVRLRCSSRRPRSRSTRQPIGRARRLKRRSLPALRRNMAPQGGAGAGNRRPVTFLHQ